MKELIKQLREMEKAGYETVTIAEILRRIRNIQSDARCKRLGLND